MVLVTTEQCLVYSLLLTLWPNTWQKRKKKKTLKERKIHFSSLLQRVWPMVTWLHALRQKIITDGWGKQKASRHQKQSITKYLAQVNHFLQGGTTYESYQNYTRPWSSNYYMTVQTDFYWVSFVFLIQSISVVAKCHVWHCVIGKVLLCLAAFSQFQGNSTMCEFIMTFLYNILYFKHMIDDSSLYRVNLKTVLGTQEILNRLALSSWSSCFMAKWVFFSIFLYLN